MSRNGSMDTDRESDHGNYTNNHTASEKGVVDTYLGKELLVVLVLKGNLWRGLLLKSSILSLGRCCLKFVMRAYMVTLLCMQRTLSRKLLLYFL